MGVSQNQGYHFRGQDYSMWGSILGNYHLQAAYSPRQSQGLPRPMERRVFVNFGDLHKKKSRLQSS